MLRRNTGLDFDDAVFHTGRGVLQPIMRGPIVGTEAADTLIGTAGDDVMQGLGGDDRLSGSAGADRLEGGDGRDTLDGGTGADALIGGAGDDTYVVDNADDQVVETAAGGIDTVLTTLSSYTLGATLEHLAYQGSGTFRGVGSAAANSITGGAGADMLSGVAGNDTLEGADGADQLDGGAGNDLLRGGAGNDTLAGGTGSDSMIGGGGDDLYVVDAAGDTVVELFGEGTDTVRTSLSSYALGAHVEHLERTGAGAFSGTGNGLANRLTGADGIDTLNGRDGADVLIGAAGADRLTGGEGADTFVFRATGDSGTSTTTRDRIMDFQVGIDRIDLSAIDANVRVGGDQAFVWRGTQAITGAGQLNMTYEAATNTTIVRGNVNAQLAPEFTIELVGNLTRGPAVLIAADFVL